MDASTQQSATAVLAGESPELVSTGLPLLALSLRISLFVIVFTVEWSSISSLVHKGRGAGSLLQFAVVFVSLFLALGYAKAKNAFHRIAGELARTSIGWGFLAGHLFAFLGFVGLSFLPLGSNSSSPEAAVLAVAWFVTGSLSIVLAGSAFMPPRLAFHLVRSTGYVWVYALVVGAVACKVVTVLPLWNGFVWKPATDLAWQPATDLTFGAVKAFLSLFISDVVADRTTMTIGSQSFTVTILPWCAGFEGTGLMLVFSLAWLCFFRREFRFPQALLLIPASMVVIWMANAVRITALILIGIAGAPATAQGGFHSQAGWIAFNCVALGFVVTAQRLSWFTTRRPKPRLVDNSPPNPTAAYLMPFLAILAAAMISRAASGKFEWLYPLRFIAAAAALWVFRPKYADLNWRFAWFSPVAGGFVFVIWLVLDFFSGAQQDNGIATGLAAWSTSARITWLTFRTAAAVITVPVAEELAFRGFLIRRLMSPDFESLGFREFSFFSLLLSSVAFGLLHGDRWFAGAVAGLLYALVFLTRGRIGDAVVAHATTNALLAAWVLLRGAWGLW